MGQVRSGPIGTIDYGVPRDPMRGSRQRSASAAVASEKQNRPPLSGRPT